MGHLELCLQILGRNNKKYLALRKDLIEEHGLVGDHKDYLVQNEQLEGHLKQNTVCSLNKIPFQEQ